MADYCDNVLSVRGPTFEVELFIINHVDVADGDGHMAWLDLDSIIPYPERFKRLDEIAERWEEEHRLDRNVNWNDMPTDGYNRGGKEWCERNWGTKWNTDHAGPWDFDWTLEDEQCGFAQLIFDTAWTPISRRMMLVLSRLYPAVTFELDWEGSHWCHGLIKTRGGKLLADRQYYGLRPSGLSEATEVTFYLNFPTREAADTAGAQATTPQLSAKVEREASRSAWLCLVSGTIVPTETAIHAESIRLIAIAAAHGGEYDGHSYW